MALVLSTGAAAGFLASVGLLGDLSLIAAAIASAALVTSLVMIVARWPRQAWVPWRTMADAEPMERAG